MKKLWIALLFIMLLAPLNAAEAKTFKFPVETLTALSSENNTNSYVTLKMTEQHPLGEDIIQKDAMLRVKLTNVQNARRGKQNAYFDGVLIAYSMPSENNKVVDVSEQKIPCRIKNYSPTDFKGIAESAATSVVSQVFKVPFLSQGIAAVKGIASPIEGKTRAESAGIRVYESTPLVYANKGEEINVKPGDLLTVAFKIAMPDDEQEAESAANSNDTSTENKTVPTVQTGVEAQNLYTPQE